jgi:hypothetical protein
MVPIMASMTSAAAGSSSSRILTYRVVEMQSPNTSSATTCPARRTSPHCGPDMTVPGSGSYTSFALGYQPEVRESANDTLEGAVVLAATNCSYSDERRTATLSATSPPGNRQAGSLISSPAHCQQRPHTRHQWRVTLPSHLRSPAQSSRGFRTVRQISMMTGTSMCTSCTASYGSGPPAPAEADANAEQPGIRQYLSDSEPEKTAASTHSWPAGETQGRHHRRGTLAARGSNL